MLRITINMILVEYSVPYGYHKGMGITLSIRMYMFGVMLDNLVTLKKG